MNELAPITSQAVEAKVGKMCVFCRELKQRSQFYREQWNVVDGKDGFSDDCRSCRIAKKHEEENRWLISKGLKPRWNLKKQP